MRPALPLLAAALLLLGACAATPATPAEPSGPAATPSATPGTPSPAPSSGAEATPDPAATPSPASSPPVDPTPTVEPTGSPAPGTPEPTLTPREAALVGQLRRDAAVDCVPRRIDLPMGALRGIECRPDDPLVARVGVYRFRTANAAATAYLDRMGSVGVDPNEGDCSAGRPGDAPYMAGDGEGSIGDPGVFAYENEVLVPTRQGCFRDEHGTANVRLTCGELYLGVLGRARNLSELTDWAWRFPAGYEPGTPDVPGLCVGADLLASVR